MDLDPKTEITLAAGIMQGLLASGHYTQPNVKGPDLKHLIRRHGPNENWEAEGLRCSLPAYAVDDAMLLLQELNLGLEAGVTPVLELLRPKKPVVLPRITKDGERAKKKKAPVKKRKKQ